MKKTKILFAILSSLLFQSSILQAESFPLQYHYDQKISFSRQGQYINFRDKNQNPKNANLPDFESKKPFFVLWQTPMDPKGRWIALDATSKTKQYDVIYIDSDGDGSLADETPIKQYKIITQNSTKDYSTCFGPVEVTLNTDQGSVKYHLKFQYYNYGDSYRTFYISTGCWYEGTVILPDGSSVDCKLIDYQANGTFNDKSINFGECDRIIFGKDKAQFTGNYIFIKGNHYNFGAAQDGRSVTLTAAEDIQFGTVEFGKDVNEFAAGGENGLFYPEVKQGRCDLPVGEYRIDSWNIKRKDAKGDVWQLNCRSYSEKGIFTVDNNDVTKLAIGQPIISVLSIDKRNARDRNYYIRHSLTDQMNCMSVEISKNNKRNNAPRVFIKDKTGDYTATYDMKYG